MEIDNKFKVMSPVFQLFVQFNHNSCSKGMLYTVDNFHFVG